MRAVVQKDQGGNDMDGQDTGAAAPSRRQEHEPGFTIRRGHHTEFSGSQGASELLNLQNCSQVFDHPPQPAGGNSTSESAFREPGLVPLRNCFTSHGLNDFNYARAFEYPFQLASEISSTDNGRPDLYCPQLDDQNYARAFDYSFQPASEISISDIGQPGIQGRSASYQLDGQNYARAFDYPFQPASEILNSDSTFREADAHPDFTNGQYADDREDARNNARAFDHPTRFTAANPTPENSGCETGDLDYSTDSLDRRRPSNNYPSWIKAGGIHPPAEPAVYQNHARAFNEHCQRTMDELWSYEDITESFDTGTIQLVGEPHTAPLVA
ncbi:hypothetical protein HFD88_001673 [Aspergillus terreus]|nr:hypothetical protein HFD88_001673 [Aspergillus terreus]